MPGLVLDASASGGFLFRDEHSAQTAGLIARIEREGAIVPALWSFEISNLLRQAERRGRLGAGDVEAARALLLSLNVEVEPPALQATLGPILDLARRHGLTSYDAAYLDLAARLRLPLATRDAALARAATAERLPVLPV